MRQLPRCPIKLVARNVITRISNITRSECVFELYARTAPLCFRRHTVPQAGQRQLTFSPQSLPFFFFFFSRFCTVCSALFSNVHSSFFSSFIFRGLLGLAPKSTPHFDCNPCPYFARLRRIEQGSLLTLLLPVLLAVNIAMDAFDLSSLRSRGRRAVKNYASMRRQERWMTTHRVCRSRPKKCSEQAVYSRRGVSRWLFRGIVKAKADAVRKRTAKLA